MKLTVSISGRRSSTVLYAVAAVYLIVVSVLRGITVTVYFGLKAYRK